MQRMSAPNIAGAHLPQHARGYWKAHFDAAREGAEAFLERESGQLPIWLVIGFGAGIACWFALDGPREWLAVLCVGAAMAIAGFAFDGGRLERAFGWLGLALALGCALIWARAEWVGAPRLERPKVTTFTARVERVEPLPAKGDLRLTLLPAGTDLPPRVRVFTEGGRGSGGNCCRGDTEGSR